MPSTSKRRKVEVWSVRCELYGHSASTHKLAGDSYGHLLGRTPRGEIAEFDTFEDDVFAELQTLFQELVGTDRHRRPWFSEVIGVACDKSPAGHGYSFTGKIWCPVCSSDATHYGPRNPPEFDTMCIPQVTHREWEQLSPVQKRMRLREALQQSGHLLPDSD